MNLKEIKSKLNLDKLKSLLNLKGVKLNLLPVTIIVTLLLVGGGISIYKLANSLQGLKNEVSDKVKTNNALNDSVHFYTNKYNEVVAEKLTLQGTVKEITGKNNKLNANQIDLMKRVKELNKENIVIAAANIKLLVKIDSLESAIGVYNPSTNEIIYKDSTNDIIYNIVANNVIELPDTKSKLNILQLYIPNTQNINFQWIKDKKGDYPVSFSVSNTNKYFKVYDIDSYIIPEVNKVKIDPNGWQKIGNFISKTGGKVSIFGLGVGVGAMGIFLLTK